jgi:hypothetical protein
MAGVWALPELVMVEHGWWLQQYVKQSKFTNIFVIKLPYLES